MDYQNFGNILGNDHHHDTSNLVLDLLGMHHLLPNARLTHLAINISSFFLFPPFHPANLDRDIFSLKDGKESK